MCARGRGRAGRVTCRSLRRRETLQIGGGSLEINFKCAAGSAALRSSGSRIGVGRAILLDWADGASMAHQQLILIDSGSHCCCQTQCRLLFTSVHLLLLLDLNIDHHPLCLRPSSTKP